MRVSQVSQQRKLSHGWLWMKTFRQIEWRAQVIRVEIWKTISNRRGLRIAGDVTSRLSKSIEKCHWPCSEGDKVDAARICCVTNEWTVSATAGRVAYCLCACGRGSRVNLGQRRREYTKWTAEFTYKLTYIKNFRASSNVIQTNVFTLFLDFW